MERVEGTLLIEEARLLFRNFAGEEGTYNAKGNRNFCVVLPEETAQEMESDGWTIKRLTPREDDENPAGTPYVQVKVGYKVRPPKVYMITSRGRTLLGEDTISMLDWVEVLKCDLIVAPYNWEVRGQAGVAAYLRTMYITIQEDELDRKYADVPDAETAS
jgi:hypothetical protein